MLGSARAFPLVSCAAVLGAVGGASAAVALARSFGGRRRAGVRFSELPGWSRAATWCLFVASLLAPRAGDSAHDWPSGRRRGAPCGVGTAGARGSAGVRWLGRGEVPASPSLQRCLRSAPLGLHHNHHHLPWKSACPALGSKRAHGCSARVHTEGILAHGPVGGAQSRNWDAGGARLWFVFSRVFLV